MPYEGYNTYRVSQNDVRADFDRSGEFGDPGGIFRAAKRCIDLAFCVIAIPLVGVISLVLLIVNPIGNRGPMFFRQRRMGQDGQAFFVWKFRTMIPSDGRLRAHDAPLERHRITRVGRFLRRTRIDELPNSFNILLDEMSLVGPRPDAYEHADVYADAIPHYHVRFQVKPGITGLAQVRSGYADTTDMVRRKARHDRHYVENQSLFLDLYILWRTFGVIIFGYGAR